ncbi:spike base protein, RCAP_Rcc01079 family [Rhizobium giardinii]|uniref:spike base protein, RCAP_Rcc01079 family n=1 Tax=Rhizobium giardinii TaxID=56731 RepID=UPI0039DF2BE7
MPDRFSSNIPSLTSPATHGFTVTPSDAIDLSEVTRAIYVGSGGTLAVRLLSGQTVTFAGVSAGSILPLRADRVLATGTTAGSIVGLV